MKLALNASVVSSRCLAVILWLATAVVCLVGWPLSSGAARLALGVIGVIAGAVLAGKRWWFVRHPAHQVLQQLQDTLEMSCIAYDVSDRSVAVTSTGTSASVRGWGPLSLVIFNVRDSQSNKERFLVEVLTKYLRFIGKKDAHG